jgi:hypothetical protein
MAETTLTRAQLSALAVGMPYRSSAKKAEILAWLKKYRPEALAPLPAFSKIMNEMLK